MSCEKYLYLSGAAPIVTSVTILADSLDEAKATIEDERKEWEGAYEDCLDLPSGATLEDAERRAENLLGMKLLIDFDGHRSVWGPPKAAVSA